MCYFRIFVVSLFLGVFFLFILFVEGGFKVLSFGVWVLFDVGRRLRKLGLRFIFLVMSDMRGFWV